MGRTKPAALPDVSLDRATHDPAQLRPRLDGPWHRGANAVYGLAPRHLYDGASRDEQVGRWSDQDDCATRNGRPHARTNPDGTPESRFQFADAGMAERSARRLDARAARRARSDLLGTGG